MFNLKKDNPITIFDIGNSKITCLIFRIEVNKTKILGLGHKRSKGIIKNKIHNYELLSKEINSVFQIANKSEIIKKGDRFFSSITDNNIYTKKNYSELKTGKLGITKKIIREIYKKNISDINIKNKQLIHSFPYSFYLNNKEVVDDPIGKKCNNIGFSSFNVFVDTPLINGFEQCYYKNKIKIKNFYDSGVAASLANLSDYEKNSGTVCIDIGYYSSKVVVFLKNKIIYTDNIPLAGIDVTKDLSKGLEISEEDAELTKIMHGNLHSSYNETIEIGSDSQNKKKISRNLLLGIIKPRYEEILEIIRDNLFDNLHARIGINNIVLTGGASKIYGLESLSSQLFNRKSRIGKIEDASSFFHNKPEFSSLLGLVELSRNHQISEINEQIAGSKVVSVFDKIENWIEDSYA
ncbi:MAG: cell division protein FtsA [Rickettsiales bacterium]|nr:cell division protein FtsA [Rickettsiales bacterium]